jgi:hypothetical protein
LYIDITKKPNKIPTNIPTKFNQTPPSHVLFTPFTSTCIPTNKSKQDFHKYSNKVQPNPTMSCTFISLYFNKYSNKQFHTIFSHIFKQSSTKHHHVMYFYFILLQQVFQQTIPNNVPTNITTKFNQTPPCPVLSYPFTSISIPTKNTKQQSHKYSNKVQPNPTMSCTFISFHSNLYSNKQFQNEFQQIPTNFNQTPPCHVLLIPFYFNLYSNK